MGILGFRKVESKLTETFHVQVKGQLNPAVDLVYYSERDDDTEGGLDPYWVFDAAAEYLGFGHVYGSLWGMNFAEFLPWNSEENDNSDGTASVLFNFQVGLQSHAKMVIPQFIKCVDIAISRYGMFSPKTIVLTYAPGEASDATNQLTSSFAFLPMHHSVQNVEIQTKLNWYSDAPVSESNFLSVPPALDYFEFPISINKVTLESEPRLKPTDDPTGRYYTDRPRRSKLRQAAAIVTMPDFSLDCAGWLAAFCVSSLARFEAEDIRVQLDLVCNDSTDDVNGAE